MKTKWDKIRALGILFNGIGILLKAILSIAQFIYNRNLAKKTQRYLRANIDDDMIWNFPNERKY